MKCTYCEEEGERSTIYNGGGTKTLMGGGGEFWDEDGERHFHEVNTTTWYYRCSRGHQWLVKSTPRCPNSECNYGFQGEPVRLENRPIRTGSSATRISKEEGVVNL